MILFYKKYYPRMDAEAAAYMAGLSLIHIFKMGFQKGKKSI